MRLKIKVLKLLPHLQGSISRRRGRLLRRLLSVWTRYPHYVGTRCFVFYNCLITTESPGYPIRDDSISLLFCENIYVLIWWYMHGISANSFRYSPLSHDHSTCKGLSKMSAISHTNFKSCMFSSCENAWQIDTLIGLTIFKHVILFSHFKVF